MESSVINEVNSQIQNKEQVSNNNFDELDPEDYVDNLLKQREAEGK